MKPRDLNVALGAKKADQVRMDDAEAQYFKVTGEVTVTDPGEAIVDLVFPVLFVDKPRFSFGSHLTSAQSLTAGSFPTLTATVARWGTRERDDGTVVYSGATVVIVTTGTAGQSIVFQWHMEGTALRGPVYNV